MLSVTHSLVECSIFDAYSDKFQFGDSQIVPKAKLGEIVQATVSSFASPDSETTPNQLVLVTHNIGGDLDRLAKLKVSEYAVRLFVVFMFPISPSRASKQYPSNRHSSI